MVDVYGPVVGSCGRRVIKSPALACFPSMCVVVGLVRCDELLNSHLNVNSFNFDVALLLLTFNTFKAIIYRLPEVAGLLD